MYLGKAFSPFRTKDRESVQVPVPGRLSAILGDPGEWCTPATGATSEYQSLIAHLENRILNAQAPSQQAVEYVVGQYPKTVFSHGLRDQAYWIYLISTINRASSPGYPLALEHVQNKTLIDQKHFWSPLVRQAIARIEALASIDHQQLKRALTEDRAYAVKHGLCDVVRVMIKNAIHPLRKKHTGKWRLVRSPSLVDQLVEKFLYCEQDEAEIANWQMLPSKPGFGLTDVDAKSLQQYVEEKQLNASTDVSAWDFAVSEPWLMAEAEMRIMLALAPDWWKRAVRNQFLCSSRAVIMLSDGRCLALKVPGTMASGRKVTASSNSRLRVLLNAEYMLSRKLRPAAMAMGDDCVERIDDFKEYASFANNCGFKLTDYQSSGGTYFEFCSHAFKDGLPVPLDPAKMILNALTENSEESQQSLWNNLRNHPCCDAIKQYFSES